MQWQDVAKQVAGLGLRGLGEALAGPAGETVGADVAHALGLDKAASPQAVHAAIEADPQAAVKLAGIEAQVKAEQIAADAADVQAVNDTMQAEDKTGRGDWRDFIGYTLGVLILCGGAAVLGTYGPAMLGDARPQAMARLPGMLGALAGLVGVTMPILGINAWHKGGVDKIKAAQS